MNQILSFMESMIDKVMSGEKDLTTRLFSKYRDKLRVGDIAYIYTGIRTPKAKKWGEAEIVGRVVWNQKELNKDFFDFIPMNISYNSFYKREGFESWVELMVFFNHERYKGQYLITYEFKLLPTLKKYLGGK